MCSWDVICTSVTIRARYSTHMNGQFSNKNELNKYINRRNGGNYKLCQWKTILRLQAYKECQPFTPSFINTKFNKSKTILLWTRIQLPQVQTWVTKAIFFTSMWHSWIGLKYSQIKTPKMVNKRLHVSIKKTVKTQTMLFGYN